MGRMRHCRHVMAKWLWMTICTPFSCRNYSRRTAGVWPSWTPATVRVHSTCPSTRTSKASNGLLKKEWKQTDWMTWKAVATSSSSPVAKITKPQVILHVVVSSPLVFTPWWTVLIVVTGALNKFWTKPLKMHSKRKIHKIQICLALVNLMLKWNLKTL